MQKLVSKLPRYLSFGIVGILLIMPVWTFLAVWLGEATNSYEVWRSLPSAAVILITLLTFGYAILFKPKIFRSLIKDKIVILILVFGALAVLSVWLGEATWRAKLAGLAMDGRFLLAFLAARLLAMMDPIFWRKLMDFVPKFLVVAGVTLSVIGIIQVTLLPKDFLTMFGYSFDGVAPYVAIDHGDSLRAFATLAGPNNYANYLLMALLSAAFLVGKNRGSNRKRALYALSFVAIIAGLVVSSSRAAWLAAILALAVYLLSSYKISRKVIIRMAIGLAAVSVIGVLLMEVPLFRENILHIRDDRDSSTITSNDAHADALNQGLEQVVNQPLGCGVGCAGPASYYSTKGIISENYYLQIAGEYGVIGAGLFVAIVGLILARMWRERATEFAKVWLAVGVGLAFVALFAHTFADEAVSITWFALAGGLIGLSKPRPKQS